MGSGSRVTDHDAHIATCIPQRDVGPVVITGDEVNDRVMVPLATYETPLWPSVERGARVTAQSGGIAAVIISENMVRSVLLQAPDAATANRCREQLARRTDELRECVRQTSRFAMFQELQVQIVANLLFLRLALTTADAAGHNMTTLAAEAVTNWVLNEFPELRYVSLSGNYCTDKKVSAVNAVLGRGRRVVAEVVIPAKLCRRYLRCTPDELTAITIKKNWVGSVTAGSIHSANAHFANMLLAVYLATGQDGANIVEGSQGTVFAEVRDDALYFAVTLPNIIVGTVGNGKDLPHVERNLAVLGCRETRSPGANARRLAIIAAAVVLCGELSLLAALTNPGELMAAHTRLER